MSETFNRQLHRCENVESYTTLNCSRLWEEATMTYCAIISDKLRYCQLVNSDPTPCVLFNVCPMLFLSDGMFLICTLLCR